MASFTRGARKLAGELVCGSLDDGLPFPVSLLPDNSDTIRPDKIFSFLSIAPLTVCRHMNPRRYSKSTSNMVHRCLHGNYMIHRGNHRNRVIIILSQRAVRVLNQINLAMLLPELRDLFMCRFILQGYPVGIDGLQNRQ